MTPNEAGRVLVMMQASWPQLAPDDISARLWVEDLIGCDHEASLKTFRRLRDTEDFPPSWAKFLATYDVASRPSIREQIALEGPVRRPTMSWREGQEYQESVREQQRESRVMERIKNRESFDPDVAHYDATVPMKSYDEAYPAEEPA